MKKIIDLDFFNSLYYVPREFTGREPGNLVNCPQKN